MERGCVESDEFSRSNGTEPLSRGVAGMNRTEAEGARVRGTGVKTPMPIASVPSARPNYVGRGPGVQTPGCDPACFQHALEFGHSVCSVRNISRSLSIRHAPYGTYLGVLTFFLCVLSARQVSGEGYWPGGGPKLGGGITALRPVTRSSWVNLPDFFLSHSVNQRSPSFLNSAEVTLLSLS